MKPRRRRNDWKPSARRQALADALQASCAAVANLEAAHTAAGKIDNLEVLADNLDPATPAARRITADLRNLRQDLDVWTSGADEALRRAIDKAQASKESEGSP